MHPYDGGSAIMNIRMHPLHLAPLAILLVLGTVSCTDIPIPYIAQSPPETGIRYDDAPFSVGIRRMSDAELHRQESLARAGDKRAAFNVYDHYWAENDRARARQWLLFAAELGHGSAQYILAQNYLHENDNEKAIYWARRSRDSGYPNGAELVQRLENP